MNRNALWTAKSGGHGVGAIDGDLREEVEELIDELANEHFENAEFGD